MAIIMIPCVGWTALMFFLSSQPAAGESPDAIGVIGLAVVLSSPAIAIALSCWIIRKRLHRRK